MMLGASDLSFAAAQHDPRRAPAVSTTAASAAGGSGRARRASPGRSRRSAPERRPTRTVAPRRHAAIAARDLDPQARARRPKRGWRSRHRRDAANAAPAPDAAARRTAARARRVVSPPSLKPNSPAARHCAAARRRRDEVAARAAGTSQTIRLTAVRPSGGPPGTAGGAPAQDVALDRQAVDARRGRSSPRTVTTSTSSPGALKSVQVGDAPGRRAGARVRLELPLADARLGRAGVAGRGPAAPRSSPSHAGSAPVSIRVPSGSRDDDLRDRRRLLRRGPRG